MNSRQLFIEGYKAGYKKALKEGAWSSPIGGANIYAKQQREEQAKKYGQPRGGELETVEIPVHIEYGLKSRRVRSRMDDKQYPMIRLTSGGKWIPGLWTQGYQEKNSNEYFYDPELVGLRPDEEAAILRCNDHGYPQFLISPVYTYMSKNKLQDNMYNTGYKMSRVLAKYAVMVINNMLKQIPEGEGEADFVIQVPYHVGRDNVYKKVFYIDERDFSNFADKIRMV